LSLKIRQVLIPQKDKKSFGFFDVASWPFATVGGVAGHIFQVCCTHTGDAPGQVKVTMKISIGIRKKYRIQMVVFSPASYVRLQEWDDEIITIPQKKCFFLQLGENQWAGSGLAWILGGFFFFAWLKWLNLTNVQ